MEIWKILLLIVILLLNFFLVLMTLGTLFGASFGAPFVPSGKKTIQKMIELAGKLKGKVIFDLGCGDGRILLAAAKNGAQKVIGIEVSPPIFFIAKLNKFFAGNPKNVEIRFGNFFRDPDISKADIIFAFLFPNLMEKIFNEIWPKLKPGTKIISHGFRPKSIKPDQEIPRVGRIGKIFIFEKKF